MEYNPYLRSLIYGGLDGIITIFNLVSGIEGGNLKPILILILGLSVLFGDSISMGFSDYLSIKTENTSKRKFKIPNLTKNPSIHGLITFLSFILFGLFPLSIYILINKYSNNNRFIKTFISTLIALFILGSIQSRYTENNWIESGIETTLYGSLASISSYSISKIISKLT